MNSHPPRPERDTRSRPDRLPHRRSRGLGWGAFGAGLLLGAGIVVIQGGRTPLGTAPEASALLSGRDVVERTARFASFLAAASPDDLDRLVSATRDFVPGPQDTELVLFADWWAGFDPEAALAWALETGERTGLDLHLAVLRAWARHDPAGALGRAEARLAVSNRGRALDEGLWSNRGMQAVLIGWDESLVPGVDEWVFGQSDVRDRQGLMSVLARRRVATGEPTEVWRWAAGLPQPIRRDMLPRVASALAARNPELAVRLAQPYLEGEALPGLPARIAMRWARSDPRAALEWLGTLAPEAGRRDAITETARIWLSQDRAGFSRFMDARREELPEWLEPAFGLHARALAREGQPKEALAISARIRDDALRTYTLTLVLRRWMDHDAPAAEEWIERAGVPDAIARRARARPGQLPTPARGDTSR